MSNTFDYNRVINDARAVITRPADYFQTMEKTGGFANPLIFVVVMAAIMGVITAVMSLFGSAGMLAVGFGAIIIMPIGAVIGSFIGAGILFIIWKLMGSEQSYETAYRCLAAATAIYPIIGALSVIPYLGGIIAVAWGTYLMIEASVAVHGRDRKNASIVFGILAALMIISNISSEYASRKIADRASEMGEMLEGYEDLSPEEQGQKMGEFLKGIEQGMDKSE